MKSHSRYRLASVALTAASVAAALASAPTTASAATPCDELTSPIYQRVNPSSQSSLLTPWLTEAQGASRYGFTQDAGTAFKSALGSGSGLVPVHRLYKASTGDFHTAVQSQVSTWTAKGYTDQGRRFYALSSSASCATAVQTYTKGSRTRQVANASAAAALVSAGWTFSANAYYAVPVDTSPPPGGGDADGIFGVAVIPDTQTETAPRDSRFLNRTQWLVANKNALDLRFVLHTGDVTNWGWLDSSQYAKASAAAAAIQSAGLPYAWAIGNHDTRAVGWNGIPGSSGYGGSAYQDNPECPRRLGAAACRSWLLVRHTEEYNAVFNASRYTRVAGSYQSGKVDNIYSTFNAAGKKWLVLTLEPWARPEVINWAKQVVAANPSYNVIVQTHHYLDGDGSISSSNGGYGATSPRYLFDSLIKVYPNVKVVLSGHTGDHARRTDTGNAGNKIVSYLGNFSSVTTNPTRLLEFNVPAGTITDRVYAPYTSTTISQPYATTGMRFVG